jgi:Protein of unknown function (DUF3237)
MEKPALEFAFEIKINIDTGNILDAGKTAKGIKRIIPLSGGSFEGPSIKGEVVPGGYDWQLLRPDQVAEIDACYLLKTGDGATITIVNTGLRYGPAAIMERMAKGEATDPSSYYFRTIPVFETGDARYEWLTKHIFIANGIRKSSQVIIQVWKVL